jgi:hypothetical protein
MGTVYLCPFCFLSSPWRTAGESAAHNAFQPLKEFFAIRRRGGTRVFRDVRAEKSSDFIEIGILAPDSM